MRGKILLIATALIFVPGCNNNSWHKVSQKEANKIALNICDKWRLTDNLTIKYKDDKYYAGGKWVNAMSDILEYSVDEGYLKEYYEIAEVEPALSNRMSYHVTYTLIEKEKKDGLYTEWILTGKGYNDYHETKNSACLIIGNYIRAIAEMRETCLEIAVDYELYPLAILPEVESRYGEDFESVSYKAKGNDSLIISAKTTKNTEGYSAEYYYHYEKGLLIESVESRFNESDTKYFEEDFIYDHKTKVNRADEVKNPEEWAEVTL